MFNALLVIGVLCVVGVGCAGTEDPFEVLGVPYFSSLEQIKGAYNAALHKSNADHGESDDRKTAIRRAYEQLLDDEIREKWEIKYDFQPKWAAPESSESQIVLVCESHVENILRHLYAHLNKQQLGGLFRLRYANESEVYKHFVGRLTNVTKLKVPYAIFFDGQHGHYEELTECNINSDWAVSIITSQFAANVPIMSRKDVKQLVDVELPYIPTAVLFTEAREPPLYYKVLSHFHHESMQTVYCPFHVQYQPHLKNEFNISDIPSLAIFSYGNELPKVMHFDPSNTLRMNSFMRSHYYKIPRFSPTSSTGKRYQILVNINLARVKVISDQQTWHSIVKPFEDNTQSHKQASYFWTYVTNTSSFENVTLTISDKTAMTKHELTVPDRFNLTSLIPFEKLVHTATPPKITPNTPTIPNTQTIPKPKCANSGNYNNADGIVVVIAIAVAVAVVGVGFV